MATAWQLSSHISNVATPARPTGQAFARPRVRQAQNNKPKRISKPLVAGKTSAVKIGFRASSVSMFFPVCLDMTCASVS
jgi:hypothetical protein